MRTEEYLKIYRECGFEVDSLILELSNKAIRFKIEYPELFDKLRKRNPHCTDDDFIIFSNFVRLQKADRS